jgi:hypothetical protein
MQHRLIRFVDYCKSYGFFRKVLQFTVCLFRLHVNIYHSIRWIVGLYVSIFNEIIEFVVYSVCLTACHTSLLTQTGYAEMWQRSLQGGITVRLFRDEVLHIHQYIQQYFETLKGYHKRLADLKECYSISLQNRYNYFVYI